MHSRRLARLNELIQQQVSRFILTLKDPGLGFVTITSVEVTPDVSVARVYFSVLGDDKAKQSTIDALNRAKSRIRREVSKLENLKKVPDFMFVYDGAFERAGRVFNILNKIEEEKKSDSE